MFSSKKVPFLVILVCLIVIGMFVTLRDVKIQDLQIPSHTKKETEHDNVRSFGSKGSDISDNIIPKRGRGNSLTIPARTMLRNMTRAELEELYYSYIENIQTWCVRQRHIGNENDGGYHICEDVMDNSKPCLMYSFGNRRDFSFDDGVSNQYGCHVHSFDPFDGQKDHQHSKKVTFHSIGIGGKDDTKGKILTLHTIKDKLQHSQQRIDILKIDTEGAEWDALTEMCSGNILTSVKLLIVEFHVCIQDCGDGRHRKQEQYVQYLSVFKCLYDIGFRVYFFRMWPYCHFNENGITRTTCHEVHMINES